MVRWFIEDGTQANKVASIHEVIVEIKTALDTAGVNIPFPIRTIDLSDPSVTAIVKKLNDERAINHEQNTKSDKDANEFALD